ncbi:MAG: translation initiation factor [Flavobacteriales bacterium]|jgi:translation initiation factor 1|nr:translation initiation factor [Flavobacteriales bacterium]
MSKKNNGGMVYSTNPNYSYAEQAEATTPERQDLRIWLEKGGRGGKIASVIKGFVGKTSDLEQLAKQLKTQCGTGGNAKDGDIIIQGDHRDKILKILSDMGHLAKKAGG